MEVSMYVLGDDMCKGGLSTTRWPPEDHGEKRTGFEHLVNNPALGNKVLLSYEFLQIGRSESICEIHGGIVS